MVLTMAADRTYVFCRDVPRLEAIENGFADELAKFRVGGTDAVDPICPGRSKRYEVCGEIRRQRYGRGSRDAWRIRRNVHDGDIQAVDARAGHDADVPHGFRRSLRGGSDQSCCSPERGASGLK